MPQRLQRRIQLFRSRDNSETPPLPHHHRVLTNRVSPGIYIRRGIPHIL
ncbi:MAG: hypothetical protein QP890_01130 [Corynebacterium amycolatum]|nr:hypothetical protein [Corynebacterium amycolatum]MDK8506021.1 hypothetical protein [Corynebacterium amycolatum]